MNYLKINKEDVCNGEGLRVVLWLSGCSHHCYNCQNPHTWDENSGIPFDETAKEELFRELDKDYISGLTLSGGDPLFESNLDEVLDLVTKVNKQYNTIQDSVYVRDKNNNILTSFADKIRLSSSQKTIWLYTGYTWEEIEKGSMDEQLKYEQWTKRAKIITECDILVDGQYIDSQRDLSLPYRGSKNQRLIDIQKSLQQGEVVLWQT